eukprot:4753019-Pyramimonas_sp.AAC.1
MTQRPYAVTYAGRQRGTPHREEGACARPFAGSLRANVGEDDLVFLRRSCFPEAYSDAFENER